MCLVMDLRRFPCPGGICNHHARFEQYAREFSRAIGMFHGDALRLVSIFHYYDSGIGAQVQDPEHVAGGQGAK